MSDQVQQSVLVNETRTDIGKVPVRTIIDGPVQVTTRPEGAQSFDVNNMSWDITTNANLIVDRNIRVRARFRVTSAVGGEKLFVNGTPQFSAKAHPMMSVCSNLSFSINGAERTTNPSEYINGLLHYGNKAMDDMESSLAPNMPDQFLTLADWKDPVIGGLPRNPLCSFGNNSDRTSRGGFQPVLKDAGDEWAEYEFSEPLWISPLLQNNEEDQGFYNVNKLACTLSFNETLNNMWSVDSSEATHPTGLVTTLVGKPVLDVTYITPNAVQRSEMDATQVLPYSNPEKHVIGVSSMASGATATVLSQSVTMGSIPSSIYVFCRRARSETTQFTTATYARINNLSVTWDNRPSLLSNKSPQALYQMCSKNGCKQSYEQFRTFQGTVIKINVADDLGLGVGQTVGSAGSYQLDVQLQIENQASDARAFEFYMLPITEGTYSVFVGGASTTIGGITVEQVLAAEHLAELPFHHDALKGGSFFSQLGKGIKSVVHFGSDIVKEIAPVVGAVLPLLKGGGTVGGSAVTGVSIIPQQATPVRRGRKAVLRA